jgi:hypothetical protein
MNYKIASAIRPPLAGGDLAMTEILRDFLICHCEEWIPRLSLRGTRPLACHCDPPEAEKQSQFGAGSAISRQARNRLRNLTRVSFQVNKRRARNLFEIAMPQQKSGLAMTDKMMRKT